MKLEKIELLNVKIDDLFNAVYDLTTGQYELSKLEGLPKSLSEFIKDEVWSQDGQLYFSMKKINDISSFVKKIEGENNKYNPNYNSDENLIYHLNIAFDDYSQKLCKIIFYHGMHLGSFKKI